MIPHSGADRACLAGAADPANGLLSDIPATAPSSGYALSVFSPIEISINSGLRSVGCEDKLSLDHIEQLREIFQREPDGLQEEQFVGAIQQLLPWATSAQLRLWFHSIDANANGFVDWDELTSSIMDRGHRENLLEKVRLEFLDREFVPCQHNARVVDAGGVAHSADELTSAAAGSSRFFHGGSASVAGISRVHSKPIAAFVPHPNGTLFGLGSDGVVSEWSRRELTCSTVYLPLLDRGESPSAALAGVPIRGGSTLLVATSRYLSGLSLAARRFVERIDSSYIGCSSGGTHKEAVPFAELAAGRLSAARGIGAPTRIQVSTVADRMTTVTTLGHTGTSENVAVGLGNAAGVQLFSLPDKLKDGSELQAVRRWKFLHDQSVSYLHYPARLGTLLTAGLDGKLSSLHPERLLPSLSHNCGSAIFGASFCDVMQSICYTTGERSLYLWNCLTPSPVLDLTAKSAGTVLSCVANNSAPHGQLISLHEGNFVNIWDLRMMVPSQQIILSHLPPLSTVAFDVHHQCLVLGGDLPHVLPMRHSILLASTEETHIEERDNIALERQEDGPVNASTASVEGVENDHLIRSGILINRHFGQVFVVGRESVASYAMADGQLVSLLNVSESRSYIRDLAKLEQCQSPAEQESMSRRRAKKLTQSPLTEFLRSVPRDQKICITAVSFDSVERRVVLGTSVGVAFVLSIGGQQMNMMCPPPSSHPNAAVHTSVSALVCVDSDNLISCNQGKIFVAVGDNVYSFPETEDFILRAEKIMKSTCGRICCMCFAPPDTLVCGSRRGFLTFFSVSSGWHVGQDLRCDIHHPTAMPPQTIADSPRSPRSHRLTSQTPRRTNSPTRADESDDDETTLRSPSLRITDVRIVPELNVIIASNRSPVLHFFKASPFTKVCCFDFEEVVRMPQGTTSKADRSADVAKGIKFASEMEPALNLNTVKVVSPSRCTLNRALLGDYVADNWERQGPIIFSALGCSVDVPIVAAACTKSTRIVVLDLSNIPDNPISFRPSEVCVAKVFDATAGLLDHLPHSSKPTSLCSVDIAEVYGVIVSGSPDRYIFLHTFQGVPIGMFDVAPGVANPSAVCEHGTATTASASSSRKSSEPNEPSAEANHLASESATVASRLGMSGQQPMVEKKHAPHKPIMQAASRTKPKVAKDFSAPVVSLLGSDKLTKKFVWDVATLEQHRIQNSLDFARAFVRAGLSTNLTLDEVLGEDIADADATVAASMRRFTDQQGPVTKPERAMRKLSVFSSRRNSRSAPRGPLSDEDTSIALELAVAHAASRRNSLTSQPAFTPGGSDSDIDEEQDTEDEEDEHQHSGAAFSWVSASPTAAIRKEAQPPVRPSRVTAHNKVPPASAALNLVAMTSIHQTADVLTAASPTASAAAVFEGEESHGGNSEEVLADSGLVDECAPAPSLHLPHTSRDPEFSADDEGEPLELSICVVATATSAHARGVVPLRIAQPGVCLPASQLSRVAPPLHEIQTKQWLQPASGEGGGQSAGVAHVRHAHRLGPLALPPVYTKRSASVPDPLEMREKIRQDAVKGLKDALLLTKEQNELMYLLEAQSKVRTQLSHNTGAASRAIPLLKLSDTALKPNLAVHKSTMRK